MINMRSGVEIWKLRMNTHNCIMMICTLMKEMIITHKNELDNEMEKENVI